MGPDIGAVVTHVDGQIADELNSLLPGMGMQFVPLLGKEELRKEMQVHPGL